MKTSACHDENHEMCCNTNCECDCHTVAKTNTLEGLAAEALQIQDACNLSGLAIRFAVVVVELRECLRSETGGVNTDDVNQHPIVTMWLAKMADLNRTDKCSDVGWGTVQFSRALDWCTHWPS